MRFPSLAGITESFIAATRRFPVPMLVAILGSAGWISWVEIENQYESDHIEWLLKCTLVSILALPVTIALTAFAEARSWEDWRKWVLLAGGLALLALYYTTIDIDTFDELGILRYVGLLVIAHLLVSFSPYLNQRPVSDFWTFNASILGNFMAGAFYMFILWGGLSGAILGVNELFELNVSGKIYLHLFTLLAGVFNTAWFLYHYPARFEFETDIDLLFQTLCKYILIPISVLYFLILYVYTGKIILTWELPKGWVASLVIGFAAFGIFTWLLNFMLARRLNSLPFSAYAKWFWLVLLPMIGLLFVGIGRRIGDYGITKERYIVAETGLWLLACALYFVVSKKDNIKFVPISLAIFAFVALYGPLNMVKISDWSQTRILQSLLEKNGLWENGKLIPAKKQTSLEDYPRIYDVLHYVTARRDFSKNKPEWLSNAPDSILEKNSWNNSANLLTWMKVGNKAATDMSGEAFHITGRAGFDVLIPPGFTSFFDFEQYADNEPATGDGKITPAAPVGREKTPESGIANRYFTLDTSGLTLSLRTIDASGKSTLVDVYVVKNILKEWASGNKYQELPPNKSYRLAGRKTEILMLPESATVYQINDTLQLTYLKSRILLKSR